MYVRIVYGLCRAQRGRASWAVGLSRPLQGARSAPFSSKRPPRRVLKKITARAAGGEAAEALDGGASVLELQEMKTEIRDSFMAYAMSTILSRALPDARDGLKPVHRRVLYAMHALRLTPDSPFRKCARIVGEVLGKYHPHGDQSVYDALVRMAQPFSMAHPLISGHGNFGSVDDDPPAAMRYTEARMSLFAEEALMTGIREDTVDFASNFDGSESEPLVFPARVPLLLLNGSSGIAVGMSTNIPPHNLGELMQAIVQLIKQPNLSENKLLDIVPGPDFPTFGEIVGRQGSRDLHKRGKGSVKLRGKADIVVADKGKHAIIITELPYMVIKSALVVQIANLVCNKKLDGVTAVRDESDRDGMRIVVELRRAANATVVLNNLYMRTRLQTTFPGHMLAIVDGGTKPERLNLKRALQLFIDFRCDTVRRRSRYVISQQESRLHVLEGLSVAISRVDEIIDLVKASKDSASARVILCSPSFGLSATQADAVLSLRLGRITKLELEKLNSERAQLESSTRELKELLDDEAKVHDLIIKDCELIAEKFSVPRRSKILEDELELSKEDLVSNERCTIVLSGDGYVKRLMTTESARSDKEEAGGQSLICNSLDSVVFLTERGTARAVKAYKIPVMPRSAKGIPRPQVMTCAADDAVVSMLSIGSESDTDRKHEVVLLSANGFGKKIDVNSFEKCDRRQLIATKLKTGDTLKWASSISCDNEVLIATRCGRVNRVASVDFSTFRSPSATGKGVLRMDPGNSVSDADCTPTAARKDLVLALSDKGSGRLLPAEDIECGSNKRRGTIVLKFPKNDQDALKCIRFCSLDDTIVIETSSGVVISETIATINSSTDEKGRFSVAGRIPYGDVVKYLKISL